MNWIQRAWECEKADMRSLYQDPKGHVKKIVKTTRFWMAVVVGFFLGFFLIGYMEM